MKTPIDLVLPCYNPVANWVELVVQGFRELQEAMPDVAFSLTIVNDGSQRGITAEHLASLKQAIPGIQILGYEVNKGKGYALRYGINTSKAAYCLFTDIDFPYTTASMVQVCESLIAGADIAAGARDDSYYAHTPGFRRWLSRFLKWLIRYFLRLPVADTQCGLKGFNHTGRQIFLRTTINRYLFDLEFFYLAGKNKQLKIQPILVALKPGIVFSQMNMRILRQEGWSFFRILLRSIFGR